MVSSVVWRNSPSPSRGAIASANAHQKEMSIPEIAVVAMGSDIPKAFGRLTYSSYPQRLERVDLLV
jgi:hypothetical protein